VFVVAAIGMTCGAGLYIEALIATVLVLIALQIIGAFEGRLGWKRYPMIYEVRADVGTGDATVAVQRMQRAMLRVLDSVGQRLSVLERDNVAGIERVAFPVMATKRTHAKLLAELRQCDATDQVVVFADAEED
jgi:putative Mg2+ transporter-C (MgtC) family protein